MIMRDEIFNLLWTNPVNPSHLVKYFRLRYRARANTLIERESQRKLALLGGYDKKAKAGRRR